MDLPIAMVTAPTLLLTSIYAYTLLYRTCGHTFFYTYNVLAFFLAFALNLRSMSAMKGLLSFPNALINYVFLALIFKGVPTASITETPSILIYTHAPLLFFTGKFSILLIVIQGLLFMHYMLYSNIIEVTKSSVDGYHEALTVAVCIFRIIMFIVHKEKIGVEQHCSIFLLVLLDAALSYRMLATEMGALLEISSDSQMLLALVGLLAYMAFIATFSMDNILSASTLLVFSIETLVLFIVFYFIGYKEFMRWTPSEYRVHPVVILMYLICVVLLVCYVIGDKRKYTPSLEDYGVDGIVNEEEGQSAVTPQNE